MMCGFRETFLGELLERIVTDQHVNSLSENYRRRPRESLSGRKNGIFGGSETMWC